MPFELVKAFSQLATHRKLLDELEREAKGAQTQVLRARTMGLDGSKVIAARIKELRRLGVDGDNLAAYMSDPDVKTFVKELDGMVEAAAERESAVSGKLKKLKDVMEDARDEASDAQKELDRKKAAAPKGKGRDLGKPEDIADAYGLDLKRFASSDPIAYALQFKEDGLYAHIKKTVKDAFDSVDAIAAQDSIAAIRRRLEPKVMQKCGSRGAALYEKCMELIKAKGPARGGSAPKKSSPLEEAMEKENEDVQEQVDEMLKELRQLAKQMKDAVAGEDESKITPLKDSPKREAKDQYKVFQDAKATRDRLQEFVANVEKAANAAGLLF